MSRAHELRLVSRIAQMYHKEGLRQAEIAQHLRLSQATVSRMLKRAVHEGIVRTTIIPPPGTFGDLEDCIRSSFGLSEVIVVDCTEDREAAIMARIGEAAAHFLEVTLQDGEIIGVSSWSQTILRMVENVHPMRVGRAAYVVQTLGGLGAPNVQDHATHVTMRLAQLTGAQPRLFSVPGVAPSREARELLMADSFVQETMSLFGKVTLSFVGIGPLSPSEMLARSGNAFSEAEIDQLAGAGAVGNMSLRFYDQKGQPVRTRLDDRVIGMTLDEMRGVGRHVALAGGRNKTEAIAGALRTGAVDVLITDKFTASRLVQMQVQGQEHATL
ncbi:sugar-binding transcriptional regulator [Rubellimicrobium arenae]|uniref:sugar-binding transcriptional regulator n=1 Tax=Rubellimicrobium arenae TaxID=2817372 RepID=UPI001B304469|nr:sugar-binding transcriptional regulator [Rubellimicrobium arenae]